MKKSSNVPAALLMTVAATAISGCSRPRYDYSTEVRRCLDPSGKVVPDYQCERPVTGYGHVGYNTYPRWVYGGNYDGRTIRNFRSSPTPGNQVVSGAGRVITRGGFGSSSRGGGGFFSGWGG